MASSMKFLVALALIAALVCLTHGQDYDDEDSPRGNDGYGGFSGGGDDDYAAPRDRGVVGAEGSDINQGYHPQGDSDAANDNYDAEDVAAAASHARPTVVRPHLIKLIKPAANRRR